MSSMSWCQPAVGARASLAHLAAITRPLGCGVSVWHCLAAARIVMQENSSSVSWEQDPSLLGVWGLCFWPSASLGMHPACSRAGLVNVGSTAAKEKGERLLFGWVGWHYVTSSRWKMGLKEHFCVVYMYCWHAESYAVAMQLHRNVLFWGAKCLLPEIFFFKTIQLSLTFELVCFLWDVINRVCTVEGDFKS